MHRLIWKEIVMVSKKDPKKQEIKKVEMPTKNFLEILFRKTHIRMFNPPYAKSDFEEMDDPQKMRKHAYDCFSSGKPEDFVLWVEEEFPHWRHSDLALHLVGQAMKLSEHPYEARACLQEALRLRKLSARPLQIASTLLALSEVARYLEEHDVAWECLNEAVDVCPEYRSSHLNRFCLASLAKEEFKLKELFEEMQKVYPAWSSDRDLCRGLKNDGELEHLRSLPLWKQMLSLMQENPLSVEN